MELLGVSYAIVMKSVIITAILFYIGIFIMVHMEAVKRGLMGLDRKQLPIFKDVMAEGAHFIIPVSLLIFLIAVLDWSLARSAFFSLVSVPFIAAIRRSSRIGFWRILKAMESGIIGVTSFMALLVCANIIIGMITLTGLGLKISGILTTISGGNLFILLVLTMISSIILGMGVPTTCAYLIVAVLICPALIELGINPMAAHLFVFFFAIISAITPPVAVAAFIGAGIARAPMWKTAFTALKISLAIFVLPFAFIYNPALVFQGSILHVLISFLKALAGFA